MTAQDVVDVKAMGEFLPELDLLDRCDRCGARACVSVLVKAALPVLALCGYHASVHETALVTQSIAIRNDGWRAK